MRSDYATPNGPNKNNAFKGITMAIALQRQSTSGGTIELRHSALSEGYRNETAAANGVAHFHSQISLESKLERTSSPSGHQDGR